MCIRDRPKVKARAIDSSVIGMAIRCGCKSAKRKPQKGNSCLLYTSDAADERSSVDLGGRRIIKKKKLVSKSEVYDTKTISQQPHARH